MNEEHFTIYLQHKHSGMFANHKYEELSYPKNLKMCNPILETLLKMGPHYSPVVKMRPHPTAHPISLL